jgi:hypothetical protein
MENSIFSIDKKTYETWKVSNVDTSAQLTYEQLSEAFARICGLHFEKYGPKKEIVRVVFEDVP